MKKEGYLAVDFGASSGRLILGVLEDNKISTEEIHRFSNDPVKTNDGWYWDYLRLFHELKQGLIKVSQRDDVEVKAIGIDTWGVDICWLDEQDKIISSPMHYRDSRTTTIMKEFEEKIDEEQLYMLTGIKKMDFNTIYQIYHDMTRNNVVKEHAKSMLFMPDLFGFLLTGKKYNEYSIVSTGAILDPFNKQPNNKIFEKLGINNNFINKIVEPGTVIGTLTKNVQEETGLGEIPVVAVGSHDTASAVAGTPLQGEDEAFLICGTWCIMGMELDQPIVTKEAMDYGFSNEGGVENKIRFVKNINGLWLIQQIRKSYIDKGIKIDYPDIIDVVSKSNHDYKIDVEDQRFMAPIDMVEEIKIYCNEVYGVELEELGDIAKAAYNGLAYHYKETVEGFERTTGKFINTIRMVGGGIQDKFLCSHVEKTLKRKLVTGPKEASCFGNLIMQMKAMDKINTLDDGRKIISNTIE